MSCCNDICATCCPVIRYSTSVTIPAIDLRRPTVPVSFPRIIGDQTIIFTDSTTGFSWSVDIQNSPSGSCGCGFVNLVFTVVRGLNISGFVMLGPNVWQITDNLGRTFVITFSTNPQVNPTIQFTSVDETIPGGAVLQVVYYRCC
jgi:hypothetical protein